MHARAATGSGVDVYLMPEHGQHPPREVEADAGGLAVCAAIVAGIAALEHARQIFRGDADARVGDDQMVVFHIHGDGTLGRVLDGVGKQLLHAEAEPLFIRQHLPAGRLYLQPQPLMDKEAGVLAGGGAQDGVQVAGAQYKVVDVALQAYIGKQHVHVLFDLEKLARSLAVPVALARLTTSAGHVVFAGLVATLGTVSLAAHSIALTAEQAFYIPVLGINTAAATLTGNALGEKNARKLDMVGRSTIVVTLIMMSITGGLLFLFAPQVMGIFSPDARVVTQGTAILRLVALSEPIFGIAIGVEGMLQGAGDTMVPFVITTATMWMVRILGTVLVLNVFHQGLSAVWTCMVAENTVRGVLYLVRYLRGRWKPPEFRVKATL